MSHELGSIQYTKIGVLPSQELTSKIKGTSLVAIFNPNGVFRDISNFNFEWVASVFSPGQRSKGIAYMGCF